MSGGGGPPAALVGVMILCGVIICIVWRIVIESQKGAPLAPSDEGQPVDPSQQDDGVDGDDDGLVPRDAYKFPPVGYPFVFSGGRCRACDETAVANGLCSPPPNKNTCGQIKGDKCPSGYYASMMHCVRDNWKTPGLLGTCNGVIADFCAKTPGGGSVCVKRKDPVGANNAEWPNPQVKCLGSSSPQKRYKGWYPMSRPVNKKKTVRVLGKEQERWEWDSSINGGDCQATPLDQDKGCKKLDDVTLPNNLSPSSDSDWYKDKSYSEGDATPCRCELDPTVRYSLRDEGEKCSSKDQCFNRNCFKGQCMGLVAGQGCENDYECRSNHCGPARSGSNIYRRCYNE